MKAVLISIHPKWVHKILDGSKTIEVRKTRPKIETPFKCYIYMTAGSRAWSDSPADIPDGWRKNSLGASRMVVAEFTCDRIDPIRVFNNGTIQNWMCYGLEKSCVPYGDIVKYIGNNQSGYGWHISDLKVYDKPKMLKDFGLKRPPQSWCYVEEPSQMKLKPDGDKVRLCDLEPGTLFKFGDCIALKTEYQTDSGRIEAYIVGSGELFHGGAKTFHEQWELLVQPLELEEENE